MAGEKLLTDARCKAAKRKEKIYYIESIPTSPNA